MATTINASATAGLVQTADTSTILQLQTAGTTAVTVDASQRVGIGTASPATKLNISSAGADVEVRASTTTSGNVRFGFDADGAYYNWIQTNRSSGAIQFAISNSEVVQINSVGGLKVLNTIGVGNTTPSTSGAGITFPATQSASSNANTLDDYEEGTWTPEFVAHAGTNPTVTYTQQAGRYVKIGRMFYWGVAIRVNTTSGGSGGSILCITAPVPILSTASNTWGGTVTWNGTGTFTGQNPTTIACINGTSLMYLHTNSTTMATSDCTVSQLANGSNIEAFGMFETG